MGTSYDYCKHAISDKQPWSLTEMHENTIPDMPCMNLSSPKPGHTTGESGRRSAQQTVGRGEAGQTVNNCSERLFASTNKGNLCKPVEEQNKRLTSGRPAVCQRFRRGTASALRCWLLTSVPTAICLCKPFLCKACPRKVFSGRK